MYERLLGLELFLPQERLRAVVEVRNHGWLQGVNGEQHLRGSKRKVIK